MGTWSQCIQVQHFDNVAAVRKPSRNMGLVGSARGRQFGADQLAFAGNRKGHPLGSQAVVSKGDEIKAARRKILSYQLFGDITNRNNSSAAQDDSLDLRGLMRKSKNPARRDQLGSSVGSNGKSPLTQPQQDKRLQLEIGRDGHGLNLLCEFISLIQIRIKIGVFLNFRFFGRKLSRRQRSIEQH